MTPDDEVTWQTPPPALIAEIASQSARSVAPGLDVLAQALRDRFAGSLSGILLYGSCMYADDPSDGIVDLYAIVDDYRTAYLERHLRFLNSVLPPNVFYLEAPPLRAKVAVLSWRDLEAGVSSWFHSYVWARFAQPVRVIFARDERSRTRLHQTLAQAVVRFLRACAPEAGGKETDVQALWRRGLTLAYAAELRPEGPSRTSYLTTLALRDYRRRTEAAVPALRDRLVPLPGGRYLWSADERLRRRSIGRWRLRRWQGRLLSIFRWAKAVYTFRDSVDYAAWKIERHTGMKIDVTPRMRRHPLLLGPWVLWRLLRRGALR